MGNWRNRLAQESYTFKVIGSSPIFPTQYCVKSLSRDYKWSNTYTLTTLAMGV